MAQQLIITTPVNSGDGTPLATAFNYCNSNFGELYSRVQTSPPESLVGIEGDQAGMYAYDQTYFYYCFADYDGSSFIWGQVTQIGNVSVTSITNGDSNVSITSAGGNIISSVNGTANIVTTASDGQYIDGLLSVTGNIYADNSEIFADNIAAGGDVYIGGDIYATNGKLAVGNIECGFANAVGSIGNATNWFGNAYIETVHGTLADIAEKYVPDAEYAPGTVVIFGGDNEITITNEEADERVAGVISTSPAYIMNSGEDGLAVALRGKVPVRVIGPVSKGDSLVTSTTPGAAISVGRDRTYAQAVFAKSLESNAGVGEKVILAVIL